MTRAKIERRVKNPTLTDDEKQALDIADYYAGLKLDISPLVILSKALRRIMQEAAR